MADRKLLLVFVKGRSSVVLHHICAKRQAVILALANRRLHARVADHARHSQLAVGPLPRCFAPTYPVARVVLEEQRHPATPA